MAVPSRPHLPIHTLDKSNRLQDTLLTEDRDNLDERLLHTVDFS